MKTYTLTIKLLRDLTTLNFFGWVDEDYNIDAIVYLPTSDLAKLAFLLMLPEKIRQRMRLDIHPQCLRVSIPKINSEPMIEYLSEFLKSVGPITKEPYLYEQRLINIATVSLPTGSFAKSEPRTIEGQIEQFNRHVELSYRLMNEKNKFFPDEIAICVMPEFYSHCKYRGKSALFMPYVAQQELLAGYCSVSKKYPSLLIIFNLTATTPIAVNDDEGSRFGHKPKFQKTNMLLGIKDGAIVYASYKLNKGPADIPPAELSFNEVERNTYWHGSVSEELMPLAYFKQFKGVTLAGSVCVDAAEGVLGKYLRKHFVDFSTDEFGPAIQIISSSSIALPTFKKRHELEPDQVVTPQIAQGLIIQADGHNTLRRSGVWLVDGDDFVRQKSVGITTLSDGVRIENYSISVRLLHNKLHDSVGRDIGEKNEMSDSKDRLRR